MKKGLAIAIGGTLVLIISIVALVAIGLFGDVQYTTTVALKGEQAASNLNELEMIRKMTAESINPIAQRAAYELGQSGCGEEYWTKTSPDINYIRNKLDQKITQMVPQNNVGNYGRLIEWDEPQITIVDGNKFRVEGYIEFKLIDESINSEARSNVTFDHEIDSSYIKLAKIGRKILEDANYRAILESTNSADTKRSNLLNRLQLEYPTISFTIIVNGADFEIEIKDTHSLVPITQAEMTELAKTEPFDQLTLKFKTAAFQGD